MANRRISAEEWVARAQLKNLVWVSEPPRRADSKTAIRCMVCQYTWDIQPNGLRKIVRCPECERSAGRVQPEIWIERIKQVEASWLSGTPSGLEDKSKSAKCGRCGQVWKVNPRSLYKGRGHPRCPEVAVTRNRITNWDEFAEKLNLRFLESPTSSNAKTTVECLGCGFTWSKRPFDIKNGSGCPKCSRSVRRLPRQRISESEWRVRAAKAGLEWPDGTPQSAQSKTKARCLTCGHEFHAFPSNVTKGHGCARCAGNSLSVTELIDRAARMNIKLLEMPTFAISRIRCQCLLCGNTWDGALKTISRGVGCPACANASRNLKRRLSIETLDELGARLGFVWLEYPINSQTPTPAKCSSCGHVWKNRSSSAKRGSSCPQCAGVYVSEETWNRRAAEANIVWLQTPEGARIPTPARCLNCGLEWEANPGHITKGTGCPGCAEYGFNYKKPALVYFLARGNSIHGRSARKVGITNVHASKVRLRGFGKIGFQTIETWEFSDGSVAASVEYEVLNWIRDVIGLPQELNREEMPIGGATETFSFDEVTDSEVIAKINEVAKSQSTNHA